MARRHLLATLLVTALVAGATYAVNVSATSSQESFATAADLSPVRPVTPEVGSGRHNADAVVGNRGEGAAEIPSKGRRLSSHNGRTIDWFVLLGVAIAGLAAFAAVLARRKPRRAAIAARGLAPSRAPPLLLSS
ncbi:MAG: hypothetical protein WEC34_06605 [Acidimicrobiia bacterium]